MVTHPSANPVPSCLTSVFFRGLVFPTWYSVAIQDFCSMLEQNKNLLRHPEKMEVFFDFFLNK